MTKLKITARRKFALSECFILIYAIYAHIIAGTIPTVTWSIIRDHNVYLMCKSFTVNHSKSPVKDDLDVKREPTVLIIANQNASCRPRSHHHLRSISAN